VRAIRHLVATAVNGMKPERVSVIDETGRLLADGAAQENGLGGGSADERKAAYESRLRQQVEAIVSSVVGPGKARVQLTADFDLNRVTQTSDKYDPEGRVVRSSQTREEQSASNDGKEGGPVSVAGELPGSSKDGSTNGGQRDQSKKTEEIVNYEISRTTKTEVIEAGRVNRISAAVLVDGRYVQDAKGEMVYQPRAKEEIDRIAALVRSAIGFDAKRGDQIEVVNLRFADNAPISLGEQLGWMKYFQFTKDDIMGAAEKGVMALLGLIVLLMVVRPLVRRIITPEHPGKAAAAGYAGVAGALGSSAELGPDGQPLQGGDSLTNTSGTNIAIVGGEDTVAISNRTSAMIDVAKVQGQVHAQSVQKVGELAEKNPHEAVSIIRSWLHEDAA
jgi:flagellar M-ring protein FliF